jgi:hypothetical protein
LLLITSRGKLTAETGLALPAEAPFDKCTNVYNLIMANSHGTLQLFDPSARHSVVERRLPHWLQAGAICFITWRTRDSIPKPMMYVNEPSRTQLLADVREFIVGQTRER